jgi:HEAT repeat protein
MRLTRRKTILVLILALVAGLMAATWWDIRARAPLPPLVKARMPAYWRTVFIGPADVRTAVRGLYAAEAWERDNAAARLGGMGPRAESARPWLLAMLADGATSPGGMFGDNPNPMLIPDDLSSDANEPTDTGGAPLSSRPPSLTERIMAYILGDGQSAEGGMRGGASGEASDALAEIGPAAVPALLVAVRDPIPQVRLEAVRALGNTADPRALEPLIKALDDRKERVRSMALLAVGQFDDPRAVEALARAAEAAESQTDREPIGRVCKVLCSLTPARSADALAAVCTGSDRPMSFRQAAACGLSRTPAGRQRLLAMLRTDSEENRTLATCGLALQRDGQAIEPLFLREEEPLGVIDPELIDVLVTATGEHNNEIAAQAIEALRRFYPLEPGAKRFDGSSDARRLLPALLAALRQESTGVRAEAVRSLAQIPGPASREAIAGLLHDPNEGVRQEVLEALTAKADPANVSILVEALKDGSDYVRQLAAKTMAKSPDPLMADALASAAADSNPDVAKAALEGLAKLRDPRATPYMVPHLLDVNDSIRPILLQVGAPAMPAVVATAKDRESTWTAAIAISAIRDPAAVPALMALAADKACPVREAAITALGEIGDKRAADLLASLLEDSAVRDPALYALAAVRDERALAPLLAELRPRPANALEPIITALGRLKDPRAVEPILAVLRQCRAWPKEVQTQDPAKPAGYFSQSSQFLSPASVALLEMGDARGVPMFFDFYGETACWNECGDPVPYLIAPGEAAFDPLVAALADPREMVYSTAAEALLKLAGDRAIPPIERAWPELIGNSRAHFLFMIARIKSPAVTELLIRLTAIDPYGSVRSTAIEQLRNCEGPAVDEAIRRAAADDPCPSVRLFAWRVLSERTGETPPSDLSRRWISGNEFGLFW